MEYADTSNATQPKCMLCQRQFKAVETLRKHNEQSALHKVPQAVRMVDHIAHVRSILLSRKTCKMKPKSLQLAKPYRAFAPPHRPLLLPPTVTEHSRDELRSTSRSTLLRRRARNARS